MSLLGRRLDPAERFGLRLTLLAAALVLVAVPFGLLLAQVRAEGWMTDVDTSAANHLHGWIRRSPAAVDVLQVVTALGSSTFLVPLMAVVCGTLLRQGRRRLALFSAAAPLLGALVNLAVKEIVSRPRPSLVDPVATASGQSFPSGHTMGATVSYGVLLVVFLPAFRRRLRPWVIAGTTVLVGAVGFTRLALGVHYLTDVIGGVVLGVAWLAGSIAAFSVWREERGQPPVAPLEGLEPESVPE